MIRLKQEPINIEECWRQWKIEQEYSARQAIIEHYLPLVSYVAGKLSVSLPKNIAKDDLESYGIIGLIDAIEKFDIDRGLKFETYASWRIRGAIIDGLRQNDWAPRSVRDKAKKIEEAYQNLEQEYLRSVTDEEMCQYLNVSLTEFQHMLQEVSVTAVCSFDDPINEDENDAKISLMIDEHAKNPENIANEFYLKESLAAAIDKLTEKERIVVSLLYFEDLALSEIAQVMELSASRISQLHSKAMLRLRGHLERVKNQLLSKH